MDIYWATWVVSLLVTTCNAVLTLFKVDKKYYLLHTLYNQLESEAWHYIHLSGNYAGHYTKGTNLIPNHENQYIYFCHTIEKLKIKQVEEEYYKSLEAQHTSNKPTQKPDQISDEKIDILDTNGNVVLSVKQPNNTNGANSATNGVIQGIGHKTPSIAEANVLLQSPVIQSILAQHNVDKNQNGIPTQSPLQPKKESA